MGHCIRPCANGSNVDFHCRSAVVQNSAWKVDGKLRSNVCCTMGTLKLRHGNGGQETPRLRSCRVKVRAFQFVVDISKGIRAMPIEK